MIDMPEKNKKTPQVTIIFNGKKHTMEEWTRRETAADKEKSLDWNAAFSEDHVPADHHAQPLVDEEAFVKQKRLILKRKKKWHPSSRKSAGPLPTIRFIWLPAAAALVVGLVIGLTMLMIFNEQNPKSKDTWTSGNNQAQSSTDSSSAVSKNDLNLSVYVVQAGLFSSTAKAERIASELRSHGPAAVMPVTGGTAILVGVAQTDAGATRLLDHFKDQGLTVFKKKVPIEASQAILKKQSQAEAALHYKKLILELLSLMEQSKNGAHAANAGSLKTADKLYQRASKSADNTKAKSLLNHARMARQAIGKVSNENYGAQFLALQQELLNSLIDYNHFIHP
ncbi:SPOR domain-containing protein [Sporolactobacillus shoreicorticis]|uniref:SPOR domain-containing protein n=1 Tax=Sporolactobacillus shoreicorticis TaxID=1923877 RepID=A0ABW5RXS7_9BACL|nr:SPOR domain-containing protein [Sporolactobacillus shoreicorticis]MCO7127944.1 SPOR domain-containing protein [Sporolactobacillus shoreicorticis]